MTKVSIIIPVYNTEKYLRRCLNSLVNQTLKDIEVIVLDDGSTDNSLKILEEYEKKYPNIIKLIRKEHSGVSDTLNIGLKKASGEYIGFVDSDDYVDIDSYKLLYDSIKNTDIKVAIGRVYVHISKFITVKGRKAINGVIDITKEKKFLPALTYVKTDKLIHRSLIKYFKMTLSVNEDLELIPYLFVKTKKILLLNKPFYHYYIRRNSLSNKLKRISINTIFNTVKPLNILKDKFKKDNIYLIYKDELDALIIKNFLERVLDIYNNVKVKDKKRLIALTFVLLNKMVPNYKNNIYYKKLLPKFQLIDKIRLVLSVPIRMIYKKYEKEFKNFSEEQLVSKSKEIISNIK